eukprot:Gb_18986 [translate_table: standard]
MTITQPLNIHKKNMVVWLKSILHLANSIPTLTTTTNALNNSVKREKAHGHGNDNVSTLCKQGRLKEALHILHFMDYPGTRFDSSTYASLLQGCVNDKALPEGKLVHAYIIFGSKDIFLGDKLVIMYAKCGSLLDARQIFDQMPKRNVVSWTVLIAAYARCGCGIEALTLFHHMQRTNVQPNQFTFASVLPACANVAALERGMEIHENIIRSGFRSDVFVGSALLDMYVKCGNIENARDVFDEMTERDVVSWNAMIAGYAQHGYVDEALKLFQKMSEPNVISWTTMIAGYAQNGKIDEALKFFNNMPETNVISWTAMIAGYAQSGRVDEALKLFQRMPERDVASWNAMIAGYAQNGHVDEALKLFQKMPERNVVSWTAMIAGYAQNGHVDEALNLFQIMPERNVVSWNAMMAGYAQNGHFDEALKLFLKMQLTSVKPNSETFASVLSICSNLAALEQGKKVHENIIRRGIQSDVSVGNALVDMYAKCGSIQGACKVFDKMRRRNVVTWTSMIGAYAMHGHGKEALCLFEQMRNSGNNPNHVTFVGVLTACCHTGLVNEGWKYFDCMSQYYHITPAMAHYCCMVDLLGRAGHLNEAYNFINEMPIEPDAAVWCSLLGACRIHTNIELGESVAERIFELDPQNAATYVLLSNIYAAVGRWDDIEKVRKMMQEKGVKKKAGCSWIEVNKQMYTFLAGHRSHP